MGREHHRHQQLRRMPLQPDSNDHHDREKRGDGAVDADQRRQQRDEEHGEDEEPDAAVLAGAADQELPGPRGDAGHVQPDADHEQGGDEDDGGITEPHQRLTERQDAGGPQGQRNRDRHEDHRQPVPDEEDDGDDDDQGSVGDRTQG